MFYAKIYTYPRFFEVCKKWVRKMIDNLEYCYNSNCYKLRIKHGIRNTKITMEIKLEYLRTDCMPSVYKILKKFIPDIYDSKCFNDGELPFHIEVRDTESGHLFEHILLEYLCEEKLNRGSGFANYMGETAWNWKKEKKGIFNITVSAPHTERYLFYGALRKSIALLDLIIKNRKTELVEYYSSRLNYLAD